MSLPSRIIGVHDTRLPGPLVLAIGGMHGNESAGVNALRIVLNRLILEPIHNRGFQFYGRLVGLRGNRRALAQGERFLTKDLNRQWIPEQVERIRAAARTELKTEDRELRELIDQIDKEIADYPTTYPVVLLDLHTTTAGGGIFSIASSDPQSLRLAMELNVPVIQGLTDRLRGTTLHYFRSENFPCEMVAVTFEAGQHEDPLSVKRSVAAIINLLRSVGCVRAQDVENKHDDLLRTYSENLPKLNELISVHRIKPEDGFRMRSGYQNFQNVRQGETLAEDSNGPIVASEDGMILMPLYQQQGEDGFFLIKPHHGF